MRIKNIKPHFSVDVHKKGSIYDLYDTLVKLRYPEVAHTHFKEFESTILTGTNRINLLSWILQKSPNSNSGILSKLKDQPLSDKLFKCYSQIGLCTDQNILLGKCEIDKQLEFLSLLTLFIKNIHEAYSESPKNNEQDSKDVPEVINKVNAFSNLPNNVTQRDKSGINLDVIESSELLKDFNNKPFVDTYTLDDLCSNVKKKASELNEQNTENQRLILEEFHLSFKNIISLPIQNEQFNIFSTYDELCTNILNIYSTFTTVNKILVNESQIKNRPVIDKSSKTYKCLNQVVQNNLVLIEQACNMFNET